MPLVKREKDKKPVCEICGSEGVLVEVEVDLGAHLIRDSWKCRGVLAHTWHFVATWRWKK